MIVLLRSTFNSTIGAWREISFLERWYQSPCQMQFIHKDMINRALRTVFCLLSGCSPEIRMYLRDLLAALAMCNMIRRLSQMLFSTI
ncbi:hypothetical protein T4B_6996 [Trichinella pseudospiralis]|uniref:Uncharacterized protein n=1 Tax=Trichinella pseudospiralis TaxID=6337 RepID=A0A0V1IHS7_TRIPS|nr:hypothetical protein T4B_6996 [Trichinella pseudospiralis]